MKKTLLITSAIISLLLVDAVSLYAQAAFNTGELGVTVNSYGRIRIYTPDTSGVQQLERITILVGTGLNSVFDYQKDAETEDPTVNVSSPAVSDYEIYGSYNNTYSFDPPDILEKLNVYGWDGGNYLLLKFTIKNRENASIDALIGMDIIPYLDEEYGFDSVTYDGTNKLIRSHRGGTNLAYKLLSHELTSLYSFEWFDNYYAEDSSYWNWMNYGSIQPEYVSNTADGPVIIPAQDPLMIATDDSVVVYYGLALGANEVEMIANMEEATQKYYSITSVQADRNSIPDGYALEQNYPNPFNPSTSIKFGIPEGSNVTLKVYNSLGEEVSNLINQYLDAGTYTYRFDASNLPSGIYVYTLQAGNQLISKKMTLIK
jgi:hypothetical protein